MGTLQRSIMGMNNARHGGSRKSVWKHARDIINAAFVVQGMVAMVQELFGRLGREDDDSWEDNEFLSWLLRTVTNTMSLAGPGGVALASGLNVWGRGWKFSIGEMPLISNAGKVLKDMYDVVQSEDSVEALIDLTGSISTLMGKAWGNIERTIKKGLSSMGGDDSGI